MPNTPRPALINLYGYGPEKHVTATVQSAAELEQYLNRWSVLWVDVQGLSDEETFQALAHLFGLHPLHLDAVRQGRTVQQLVDGKGFLSISAPMTDGMLQQIGLFLTPRAIITLHAGPVAGWADLRTNLLAGNNALRAEGAAALVLALLLAVEQTLAGVVGDLSQDIDSWQAALLDKQAVTVPQLLKARADVHQVLTNVQQLEEVSRQLDQWPMFGTADLTLRLGDIQSRLHNLAYRLSTLFYHRFDDLWMLYRQRASGPYVRYIFLLLAFFLPVIALILLALLLGI